MPPEFEKETHYVDEQGRKRKRKVARSIAEPASAVGAAGQRVYTETEKQLILTQHLKMKAQAFGEPSFGEVARKLQSLHPTIFVEGATVSDDDGSSKSSRWPMHHSLISIRH